MYSSYRIFSCGELMPGAHLPEVVEQFARLFQMPQWQAVAYVARPVLIMRHLSEDQAHQVKVSLAALGLVTKVKLQRGAATNKQFNWQVEPTRLDQVPLCERHQEACNLQAPLEVSERQFYRALQVDINEWPGQTDAIVQKPGWRHWVQPSWLKKAVGDYS